MATQRINLNALKARVQAGEPSALATWGRMLVTGDGVPVSPSTLQAGILCLRDAAHKGDGEAPAVLAAMSAFGRFQPRNLGGALQLLETSAQRGWAPSQRQLQILGRSGHSDWRALRLAAAGGNLRQPPPARILNQKPRLRVFENFASDEECDWLIGRARDHLQRARVYLESGEQGAMDARTNSEAYLLPNLQDVVSAVVLQRVAAAIGLDLAFCEHATVLNYQAGEVFGRHVDFFDPAVPAQSEEIAARGQRVATFLIYLNDDYEGGETHFIDANIRFKGRKGDALLFINVDETGAPDRTTSHQGSPPSSGEKWILSQWTRSRPNNCYSTPGAESFQFPENWLRDA